MTPDTTTKVPLRARLAFAVLLLGFVVQMAVRHAGTEPYPGLFGPTFELPLDRGGVATKQIPVFRVTARDGRQHIVPDRALFPEFRTPIITSRDSIPRGARVDAAQTAKWLCGRLRSIGYDAPRSFQMTLVQLTIDLPDGAVRGRTTLGTLTFDHPCD